MMRRIESIHRNERYKHMWTETNRREEEEEEKKLKLKSTKSSSNYVCVQCSNILFDHYEFSVIVFLVFQRLNKFWVIGIGNTYSTD